MKTRYAALPLLAACSTTTLAALDGNDLLRSCNAAVRFMDRGFEGDADGGAAFCAGFIAGFNSGNHYARVGMTFCAPNNVTAGQLTRITVKYLNEHPEQLHLDPGVLTGLALSQAYPCPKK